LRLSAVIYLPRRQGRLERGAASPEKNVTPVAVANHPRGNDRSRGGRRHNRKSWTEGPKPTHEKLIAALESLNRFDLGGVDVTYGPGVRTGTCYIDITIVKGGKFIR